MKTIILSLLTITIFSSCEKRQCYKCVEVTTFGGNKPQVSQSDQCGWTEDDKQNYVQSHTVYSHNYSTSVSCSIK